MKKFQGLFRKQFNLSDFAAFALIGIFGLAGLISVSPTLNSGIYRFLLNHWQVGWLTAFFLSILIIFIWRKLPLAEANRNSLIKDLELLGERLSGLEPNSKMMEFLSSNVIFSNFPAANLDFLDEKSEGWKVDSRQITNTKLKTAFEESSQALEKFVGTCLTEMWQKDSSSANAESFHTHIPPEWKLSDPKRYSQANKDLTTDLFNLESKLRNMHQIIHDLQIPK